MKNIDELDESCCIRKVIEMRVGNPIEFHGYLRFSSWVSSSTM
jgi:hypothetical protein